MRPVQTTICRRHSGSVLIISMMFVLVFSAFAFSLATFSGANLQIADNQQKANGARACAESGLEIIRFWLNQVAIPGTTAESERFSQIAGSLQNSLASNGISNITADCDGSSITIPSVVLNSAKGQSFSAFIVPVDSNTLQADITGVYGSISRTIRVNYVFGTRANSVFDYGVASKGPLSLAGNVELEGINVSVEASVYIESENSNLALSIIGNSQIAGDVSIVNPVANVYLQGGQAGIGGETGESAIDNHVTFGVPPTEFPAPIPGYFDHYVRSRIDVNTDTSSDTTFNNARIVAGTNPSFSGDVTLNGVVFIEMPNVVTFTGNTTVTGIIVGKGDVGDDSAANQINFLGTVVSYPLSELPNTPDFFRIKQETGTFIMAPGFELSFGGNFNTLNGAIAGNGVKFFGNAGGTINGSIINYSDQEMELGGNSDLYFNRSDTGVVPAGFVPEIVLQPCFIF